MKHVAILSSDFPPSNLPEALRCRFFTNHLEEFGWRPTVITVGGQFLETTSDPELTSLVKPNVRVIRTSAIPSRISRKIGVGDLGVRSIPFHLKALRQLHRADPVDAIFIPIPPNIPAVMGVVARTILGIPYVVDYNDPWVDDFYKRIRISERPGGRKWLLAYYAARILEPISLSRVANITTVAEGYTEEVVRMYPWIHSQSVTAIPYGGEPGDFEYVRQRPRRNPIFDAEDGKVHISYVGRGGADMQRVLEGIFAAIKRIIDSEPAIKDTLRVHFVGTEYYGEKSDRLGQIAQLAKSLGLDEVIVEHVARIPYLDTIQVLLDSAGVLIVGSELKHYSASKVFPAILSGRPVLAVLNQASSAVDIIRSVGAGEVVTFDDPTSLMTDHAADQALQRLIGWGRDKPSLADWSVFEQYTTRSMTARLAGVLDATVRREARQPTRLSTG
jgi:glycosyltransferase involved in cell wall biosynthesis